MTDTTISYDFELLTEPTQEPVSVAMVQQYAQAVENKSLVTDTEARDYTLIKSLIPAGRQRIESWLGISLITQTWVAWYDATGWTDEISLPNGPLQSVTSVKYYGLDDTEGTVSSDSYLVIDGDRSAIALNSGSIWPTATRAKRALRIEYVAGYGSGSIGTPSFTGSGLDDMVAGGEYLNSYDRTYRATISTAGATDKFIVSDNAGISRLHISGSSGASVSTSYTEIDQGLYLAWGAATGHTEGDYWDVACIGHSVPQKYQIAAAMMTGYISDAANGYLNENLNQIIERGEIPPAIMALVGTRFA